MGGRGSYTIEIGRYAALPSGLLQKPVDRHTAHEEEG